MIFQTFRSILHKLRVQFDVLRLNKGRLEMKTLQSKFRLTNQSLLFLKFENSFWIQTTSLKVWKKSKETCSNNLIILFKSTLLRETNQKQFQLLQLNSFLKSENYKLKKLINCLEETPLLIKRFQLDWSHRTQVWLRMITPLTSR